MEYSFFGDDAGLHLALYQRGSSRKQIVTGSSLARPEIDTAANKICAVLNTYNLRASQLKSVVLRCNQAGEVVAAIFTKDDKLVKIPDLKSTCKGVAVYYSNPKSPASIITRQLQNYGDTTLLDKVLDHEITYDVNSFFQVNVPVFEQSLGHIKAAVKGRKNVIDLYAGVGTIGVSVGAQVLVEIDAGNIAMAKLNAGKSKVVQASTEQALEHITETTTVIIDPPRSGLHKKVIDRLLTALPPRIVYLSCNPVTQARDIRRLQESYKLTTLLGYNFFPRTPHIESLAILDRR